MEEIVRRLDPAPEEGRIGSEFTFVVEARPAGGQKKEAEVWVEDGGERRSSRWSILCDEGAGIGGDDSAPSPLAYFAAAIAF